MAAKRSEEYASCTSLSVLTVPPLCSLRRKVYSIFAEVLQRRADLGTDLPPPRAQRSEMYSRKCGFQYEYKLYFFSIFKVPTGITGLGQPSVLSEVALNSSMSGLPIIVSQMSPNLKYDYKL